MTPKELSEARNRFRERIDSLEGDSSRCFWNIPDPSAPGYAFFPPVMYAFATTDYFSSCWAGWSDSIVKKNKVSGGNTVLSGDKRNQTQRMADFLEKYLLYDKKASHIAIKVWRHSLMHTSEPRALKEISYDSTGAQKVTRYVWTTGNPVSNHMALQSFGTDKYRLSFCVFDFIRDLRDGVFGPKGYFEELRTQTTLQDRYGEFLHELENTEFRFKPIPSGG